MLEERIRDLWMAAESLGRPVVAYRNSGAPIGLLERAFTSPVPPDVAAWFAWSNGVAYHPGQTQDDAALIPGYEPLSVDEAVAIRADSPGCAVLGSHWIPLLASGGGDFYAAVYAPGDTSSRVASVMIGENSRMAFKSIDQMVSTFVACYREGIFFVDNSDILQADDVRWIELEEDAIRDT
ncbi:hypothetical protein ACFXPY_15500 [Streptomyces sp. NPDC059153]|uniref:hypothetical protein n=1 Tax=Streptomyces sp. NPDC059153 TaxID=3346743 RepID=UPI0036B670C7